MKKLWPVLLVAAIVAAFFLWQRNRSDSPDKGTAANTDKTLLYDLSITVRQQAGGDPETVLISAAGTFVQMIQNRSPREYASEWKDITKLTVMNKAADPEMSQSLAKKLIVSSLEGKDGYAHYFGNDFPEDLIPFQVSVLQRMLIPFPMDERISRSPIQQNETDEIGIAKVRYDLQKAGEGFSATKTWQRYDQEGIKVDEHHRSITYELDPDERLLSAKGKVVLHYRQAVPARYTIELSVTRLSEHPRLAGHIPPAKSSMRKIGRPELATAVARAENKSVFTYEEAMQKLDAVTEDTATNDVYAIFSSLKDEINREPARSQEVIRKILATKERDPASRRRLSVLFGALSQTSASQIADELAHMVDQCEDQYCKVQAAAAVNTHPNPTEAAAEQMLRVGDTSADPDVASTALLAAGAVGRRLEGQLESLPKHLLDDLNDPRKETLKPAIIAAMGNHGSNEYLAALQSFSAAKDPALRGAAIYSMRYLPQDNINDILVSAAGDTDKTVAQEAYKAIEYRDLSAESYATLAKKSAAHPDAETQQLAARIFLQAYREDPTKVDTALESFKSATKLPEVRQFLDAEKQKILDEQKAAQDQAIEN